MIDVKIIRLKTGQDIITGVDYENLESSSELKLYSPMLIIFRRASTGSTMMLMPWLPAELIVENNSTIFADEVVTIMHPKEKLISYYQDMVNIHLARWLEADNILDSLEDDHTAEEYEEYDDDDISYNLKSDLLH